MKVNFWPMRSRLVGDSFPMSELKRQIDAITCLWCKLGRPLEMDGDRMRHSLQNGHADCTSKSAEILMLCRDAVESGGVEVLEYSPSTEPTRTY